MNIFELLIYGPIEKMYLQKTREIQDYEVEKWRRIEDPHENVALK